MTQLKDFLSRRDALCRREARFRRRTYRRGVRAAHAIGADCNAGSGRIVNAALLREEIGEQVRRAGRFGDTAIGPGGGGPMHLADRRQRHGQMRQRDGAPPEQDTRINPSKTPKGVT